MATTDARDWFPKTERAPTTTRRTNTFDLLKGPTTMSTRFCLLGAAAFATVAAATVAVGQPAHAAAAERSVVSSTLLGGLGYAGTSDDNTVTVTLSTKATYLIDDTVAITPGVGCAPVAGDPTRAMCAAFRLLNGSLRSFNLSGRGGNDILTNLTPAPMHVFGNDGDDLLVGGCAADTLVGGDGADTIRGGRGDDVVRLDAGNDLSAWEAGDGNDSVEGSAGLDGVRMSGSSASEQFAASASGARTRLTRGSSGAATDLVDANAVELLSMLSLGGADTMVVNNLAGTGVTIVDTSMFDFATPGGNNDTVIVNGASGAETITATDANGVVEVAGLSAKVRITGTEAAGDRLEINGFAGDDAIDSTGLSPAEMRFRADGGSGADALIGGLGDDVLSGGDGDDTVSTGPGDNVAFGGAGDDVLRGEEGDDVLDGGSGNDVLIGNAGDDVLLNGEIVFDF